MNDNFNKRKIWWLASYPKSGSTWVRMFLNAYITKFPVDINSAFQFVMGDIYPEGLQIICPKPIYELTVTEQYMYHTAMLMNLLNMNPTKDIILKTHNAKCRIDEIPAIPPTISEGAVYLIRDPRDVVISVSHHFNINLNEAIVFMNNIKQAGEFPVNKLKHILLTWSLHVQTWTTKNVDVPVTLIRYEDLVEDPNTYFREILKAYKFTSIDEERIRWAIEETSFKNLQRKEEKVGFREKAGGERFFRDGRVGQWKDILTDQQVYTIEKEHGEVMREHNYA